MSHWLHHCIECARRRRRYAHSMMRLARLDPLPTHWNIEHRDMTEAKEALRDAIGWIHAAKSEKLRSEHYVEMMELNDECAA